MNLTSIFKRAKLQHRPLKIKRFWSYDQSNLPYLFGDVGTRSCLHVDRNLLVDGHTDQITVANSLEKTLVLVGLVRIVRTNASPGGVRRSIADKMEVALRDNTLHLIVEARIIDALGAGDDGVSRNGEYLALCIFANDTFFVVFLDLGRGEDLDAFALELTELRILVDDADLSASLLGFFDNGNLAALVHCRCNFDASEAATDDSHALADEDVRAKAPLHDAQRCAENVHAEARHGPHEALARGALALNESLQSVRIDNVLVVLARNIRRNRFRANSEDDLICTKVLDVCRGDLGVQTNIDVEALDLVVVPIDHRRQFVIENLSEVQQAACLLLLIDNGDVGVTAHTHGTSSLEASRASTDDEDLLLCLVARDLVILRQAILREVNVRVDRALAGLANEDVVETTGANDARTNFLSTIFLDLQADFRLSDPMTCHTNSIARTIFDDLFANIEVVDTSTREGRKLGVLLSSLRKVDELTFRNELVSNRTRSLVETCLDGPSVNTVLLDNFDDLFEVFEALTARHEVVCRITNEDRIIFAAYTMDLIDDVGKETAAVFRGSAVLVSTMVGVLGDEAHDHVANTCMDLDDVDASLLAALSSFTVLLNDELDLVDGEFALRHTYERTRNNVFRRSIAQKLRVAIRTPLVAELQLSSELSAMLMASFCGTGKAWDKAVVPNTASTSSGVVFRMGVETVANIARTDLDKTSPTDCALLVEIDQVVTNGIVIGFLDGHWQHDETIANLYVADFKRRGKCFVFHCTAPFYKTCCELLVIP